MICLFTCFLGEISGLRLSPPLAIIRCCFPNYDGYDKKHQKNLIFEYSNALNIPFTPILQYSEYSNALNTSIPRILSNTVNNPTTSMPLILL